MGAFELRGLRVCGERLGKAAELVNEAELARGAAGPDAPFGHAQDRLDRLVAALGDEGGEAAVDILDAGLRELVECLVHPAEDVGLARQRRRRYAVGGPAALGERPAEAWQDAENADQTGRA